MLKTLREGASGGLGKFILFGFLALAVGGLVLTDVGGFFRGGTGNNNALKVAGVKVPAAEFDRDFRRLIQPMGISPQSAYQLGFTQQVVNGKIRDILVQKQATAHDIRISQKRVAAHLRDLIAPSVTDGQDYASILNQILRTQSMSEKQLERAIADDLSSNFLLSSYQSAGLAVDARLIDALYQHDQQTRRIEYIKFYATYIDAPDPTNEELRTLYNQIKDTYSYPETRDITILRLTADEDTPDALYDNADTLDSLILDGAAQADIMEALPVEVITINGFNRLGQINETNSEDNIPTIILNSTQTIVDHSFALEEGEISSTLEFDDGSIAAIQIDMIKPSGYYPFDKVTSQLQSRWVRDYQNEKNAERADVFLSTYRDEGITLKTMAEREDRTHRTISNLKRNTEQNPFSAEAVAEIFATNNDESLLVEIDGGVAVVHVTGIRTPEVTDKARASDAYAALKTSLVQEQQDTLITLILGDQLRKKPASVNAKLLERLYGGNAQGLY